MGKVARKALDKAGSDGSVPTADFDSVLRRMLNTPPDHKPRAKQKPKKEKPAE
jgi:hypothetical protein